MLLTTMNGSERKTQVRDSSEGPGQRGSFDFKTLMRHFVSGGNLRASAIGTSRSCCYLELEYLGLVR